MKYRHAFHAGNFADVHKHVTLLALLRALTRKEKGFLLLDTHAGRGRYDLAAADARKGDESRSGIEQLLATPIADVPEIHDYLELVRRTRKGPHARHAYPGSPWLALQVLRQQDRAVFVETQPGEHAALDATLRAAAPSARVVSECADGYARLAHWLPNVERRALVLVDPPYEESRSDFDAAVEAIATVLRRLPTAVIALWYPIKDERDTRAWLERIPARVPHDAAHPPTFLCGELWLRPPDNRVGLNGSGMLIVNPPWQIDTRMREWLPVVHAALDPAPARGGWRVR
jgi:23S rRNA (adenine2030-N6)-methyltransferase